MPRTPRTDHPGALHFVTNRGTAQTMIFRSDKDRVFFLWLLGELEERDLARVFAYVLMGNHYHLILESLSGGVAKAMHFLNGNHARRFNNGHVRDGALFKGRYDDRLITDEVHLERAGTYLHLNPATAGLVDNPAHYRWSSLDAYRRGRSPLPWLHLDLLDGRSGAQYFDDVMSASEAVGAVPDDDDSIHAWCTDADAAATQAYDESDRTVAQAFGVSVDELYVPAVGHQLLARSAAVVRAAQVVDRPLAEIALHYGLRNVNAVYTARRRLRRAAAEDPVVAARLRTIDLSYPDQAAG